MFCDFKKNRDALSLTTCTTHTDSVAKVFDSVKQEVISRPDIIIAGVTFRFKLQSISLQHRASNSLVNSMIRLFILYFVLTTVFIVHALEQLHSKVRTGMRVAMEEPRQR